VHGDGTGAVVVGWETVTWDQGRGASVTAGEITVSTRVTGCKRTVRVLVYDSLDELRTDADRHRRTVEGRDEPGYFGEALAVAHSFETFRYADDGSEVRGTAAGMIRYWRGRLGTSVVVHEVVHIASGIYRQDWQPGYGAAHEDMENEEVLCHLVGDLTRRIVDRLHARGFYALPPREVAG
jgi:hypothetical protein